MPTNLQSHRRQSFRPGRAGIVWLALCLAAAVLFQWREFSPSHGSPSVQRQVTPVSFTGAVGPLKAIEQIQVGERVALDENPSEPFDDSLGANVDPATWRMIRLRVEKQSGGQCDVVLLRPQWWIAERLDADGKLLKLSVPEIGIHNDAEVLSVEPCSPISGGRGRVVIGTFAHSASALVDLHVEGLEAPIRCTPNHPAWSHDKQAFIIAEDLEPGESLQGDNRLYRVVRVEHVARSKPVFNLEIHGQHVYRVSELGVLVHNAVDCVPRNAHLAGKNHPKTSIPFDKNGYPDFSGVSTRDVKITFTGSRTKDFRAANKAAGYDKTPDNFTWHHHQDGTTMQLVPRDIHAQTGHTGGFAGS